MATIEQEKGMDLVIKKRKIDNEEKSDEGSDRRSDLGNIEIVEILNDNARGKCIFLHGKISGEDAVILMEKTPFDKKALSELVSDNTKMKETLKNDIYSTYEAKPPQHLNVVKTTLIHPATTKHLMKYRDQAMFIIHETEERYRTITKPFLQEQMFSTQWVYNILEKKTEADRIVFEDSCPENGFILLPDMKWDRKDVTSLYLVAIVHRRDLASLRDLNHTHLPLLKNVLNKGLEAIWEQFGIPDSKLRVYVHYQPSYHHLHVHFTHILLEAPGFEADRAHLLADIIENIKMKSDYYRDKTIVFKVRENDGLFQKYKEAGYFDKVK